MIGQPVELSNSISQQLKVVPVAAATIPPSDPLLPEAVGHALKSVAQATNISADALLASIQLRQQQVLYQQQKQLAALAAAASSSTTTTTTESTVKTTTYTPTTISTGIFIAPSTNAVAQPPNLSDVDFTSTADLSTGTRIATKSPKQKYSLTGIHKVMNAPKEYYPVNYDKNFDDNFTSRVELPDTSFSCGEQKHFPGLYADEDLNCMVSYLV